PTAGPRRRRTGLPRGGRSSSGMNAREEPSGMCRPALVEEQWYCLFQGDFGPMAVSVESVAEVLEGDTLVRLAWSPPSVAGLLSHPREGVPVVVVGARPHR